MTNTDYRQYLVTQTENNASNIEEKEKENDQTENGIKASTVIVEEIPRKSSKHMRTEKSSAPKASKIKQSLEDEKSQEIKKKDIPSNESDDQYEDASDEDDILSEEIEGYSDDISEDEVEDSFSEENDGDDDEDEEEEEEEVDEEEDDEDDETEEKIELIVKKPSNNRQKDSRAANEVTEIRIKTKTEPDYQKLFAKVVFIENNPDMEREIVVILELHESGRFTFGKPLEAKLPYMIIPTVDHEFKVDDGIKLYCKARYLYWPENSKSPYGELIGVIGKSGDLNAEIEAIIQNYDIYNQDFTDMTKDYLKVYEEKLDAETREYIIPEDEKAKRMDLTKQIVFTCDPVTARDLDDSLSIKHISDDIFEIGVHIADVSHFVKEGTPLDADAKLRTTSVYFTHMVLPMLPRLLCENLCSLNPGVERLTFSIFLRIKENGDVLDDFEPKICKTFIKSCAKLDYDIVQEVIDGKITNPDDLPIKYLPRIIFIIKRSLTNYFL